MNPDSEMSSELKTNLPPSEQLNSEDEAYLKNFRQKKLEHDVRKQKFLTLENQLEVLLIEDPSAQESAVALDVHTGFLRDPENAPGLAHYLEHLLFLGTQKYPKVDEFTQFIVQHGGDSNAYTFLENTNFHFEVNHSALGPALDRFIQFFISPKFDRRYFKRELDIIHSEWMSHTTDSSMRKFHLLNFLAHPDHPQSRVFQGNLKTLSHVTQAQVLEYFQTHYSANRMKAVIISPLPLAVLTSLTQTYFSQIPNRNLILPKISRTVYDPATLPRIIEMKAFEEEYELEFIFQLPPYQDYLFSTPQTILSFLINFQGKNSLSQELKARGWITHLHSKPSQESYRSQWIVHFELTQLGLKNWKSIAEIFFRYIQTLRSHGLTREYFQSLQHESEIHSLFKTHETGMDAAAQLAENLREGPVEWVEFIEDLAIRYSPESFQVILDQIQPAFLQVLISSPNFTPKNQDPHFKIPYETQTIDPKDQESWKNAQAHPQLSFPPMNPYLPRQLTTSGLSEPQPRLIHQNTRHEVWLQAQSPFKKPLARVELKAALSLPKTPRESLIRELLNRSWNESNQTWAALALQAGLHSELSISPIELTFSLSGYSDSLIEFAKRAIPQVSQLQMSPFEWSATQEFVTQSIENRKKQEPQFLAREQLDYFLLPHLTHEEEYLPWIEGVSLDELKINLQLLLHSSALKTFGFGEISHSDLLCLSQLWENSVSPQPQESLPLASQKRSLLPSAHRWVYEISTQASLNAWLSYYQLGATTPATEASLYTGHLFFETSFFTEMRTHHGLGYEVSASPQIDAISAGYVFLIQSEKSLREISQLTDAWMKKKLKSLSHISPQLFKELKEASIELWKSPPSTFDEAYLRSRDALFEYQKNWNWHSDRLEAFQSLTREQLIADWNTLISASTRRNLILFVSQKPHSEIAPALSDAQRISLGQESAFRDSLEKLLAPGVLQSRFQENSKP